MFVVLQGPQQLRAPPQRKTCVQASEPKALADEKVGRASRALQLLAVAEKEMGIR